MIKESWTGIFIKDGIEYRRYKTGKIRPVKYDHLGIEIVVGYPSRKTLK